MAANIVGECIHGLTYAWCDLCRAKPATKVRSERSWGKVTQPQPHYPTVIAKFTSECPWCDGPITEDLDSVYLVDDDWVCETCAFDFEDQHSG